MRSAEGQIEGGIVMGLGMALWEKLVRSGGYIQNPSMRDYLLPGIKDAPPTMRAMFVDNSDKQAHSAKGVAEASLIPVPAAIAAAIRQKQLVCAPTSYRWTPSRFFRCCKLRAMRMNERTDDIKYVRARSIDDAIAALQNSDGGGVLVAGGIVVGSLINQGLLAQDTIIDISRIEDLRGIGMKADGHLSIGALFATHTDVLRSAVVAKSAPLLVEISKEIACGRLRNRKRHDRREPVHDRTARRPGDRPHCARSRTLHSRSGRQADRRLG